MRTGLFDPMISEILVSILFLCCLGGGDSGETEHHNRKYGKEKTKTAKNKEKETGKGS